MLGFEITLQAAPKKIALVWDINKSEEVMPVCETTNPDYVEWLAGKSDRSVDAISNLTSYGNFIYNHTLENEYYVINPYPGIGDLMDHYIYSYVWDPNGEETGSVSNYVLVNAIIPDNIFRNPLNAWMNSMAFDLNLSSSPPVPIYLGYRVKYVRDDPGLGTFWQSFSFIDHFGLIETYDLVDENLYCLYSQVPDKYMDFFSVRSVPNASIGADLAMFSLTIFSFAEFTDALDDWTGRKTIVSAQAVLLPQNTRKEDYNFIGQGRNAVLSTSLASAIELAYTANGLAETAYRIPSIEVKIY